MSDVQAPERRVPESGPREHDAVVPRLARAARPPHAGALRSVSARIGLALTLLVVALAVSADLVAPHDPFALVGRPFQPPSWDHPMGTDDLGRDVFSGVVHGSRASLVLGLGVAGVVAAVGLVVGIVSGFSSKLVDDVLMRVTEAVQVLPRFFLAIVVVALFGAGIDRLVLVLGLTSWTIVARVVRAEVFGLREREFIEAARALGSTEARIARAHLLPGVLPVAVTFVSLMVSQAILIEASLGFLGLGDPSVMSWGILAGNAQPFLRTAWWLAVFPGGAIAIAVLGINLLGDAYCARGRPSQGGLGVSARPRVSLRRPGRTARPGRGRRR